MLGRLEFAPGKWGKVRPGELYGLGVLTARADPAGRFGRWRLDRAGKGLRRVGVVRTLLPPGFGDWEWLAGAGLAPVEPGPLLKAAAPALALAALEGRELDPEGAVVALRGERVETSMVRSAMTLCPRVRSLVIDAPNGDALARRLRWEFGVPILPPEHPAALALDFQPRGGRGETPGLELFGHAPHLDGLALSAPHLGEEERGALDVLCALWEGGRLPVSAIKIHRN